MVYTKSAIEMKDVPKTSKASPTLPDRQKEIEDTTIQYVPVYSTRLDRTNLTQLHRERPGHNTSRLTFRVYKDLLCEWIPYFQACLKADWRSDSSEPIKLRHFKIEGFRVLLRWLFNEELPFHTKGAAVNWKLLDIAYETADGLAVFDLQNKLVDFVLKATRPKELYWEPKKSEILKMLQLAHTPYYRLVLKSKSEAT